MSFKQKSKITMKQRQTVKMSLIWFWVHWLAEHTPKSSKDQFTKHLWQTAGVIREGAKIILKLLYLNRRWVMKKWWWKGEKKKSPNNFQAWFWMHYLGEYLPKSLQGQHFKLCWLTEGVLRQRSKRYLIFSI